MAEFDSGSRGGRLRDGDDEWLGVGYIFERGSDAAATAVAGRHVERHVPGGPAGEFTTDDFGPRRIAGSQNPRNRRGDGGIKRECDDFPGYFSRRRGELGG